MGREDVESTEATQGEVIGWTERTDEEEEEGIRTQHDPLPDQGTGDKAQVLDDRQGQHGEFPFLPFRYDTVSTIEYYTNGCF